MLRDLIEAVYKEDFAAARAVITNIEDYLNENPNR